jgi:SSS family solute:Na+ symporter
MKPTALATLAESAVGWGRMTLLDWAIPSVVFLILLVFAVRTRRYSRSVSGFLAANRCAGRYLVCVAYNMAQVGIITLVWYFQQYYDSGFTSVWWGLVENPLMIVIALTGWVIYRFRETRALTLAQFIEIRYSRRLRVFCGMVAFVAGVLNYAIFPAVSARFFMWMCGFPESFGVAGMTVPTMPALMLLLLSSALLFVFLGGQIAVMVTDFLQGILCNIVFLVVIAWMLWFVGWDRMAETMLAAPEGRSMVNPLDIAGEQQFNAIYWLISAFVLFYTMRAWQGDQGYNAAALTPHEAKMAQLLSGWRWRVLMLVAIVVPIGVKTILTHPDFASVAAPLHGIIDAGATDAIRAESRVPLALGAVLPAGLLGLVVAAMYGAYLSTDDTYLHSWGTILVQDVVLPIRGVFTDAPLSATAHLGILKVAILSVAAFAFWFGISFTTNQYIAMWGAITASVFVGGAGIVIIGGLYTRRGTTAAAWVAMLTAMTLSLLGILVKESVGSFAWLASIGLDGVHGFVLAVHESKRISGQVLAFIAAVVAILLYAGVSILRPNAPFDLDRMLYRGRHRELLPPSERDFRDESSPGPSRWMRALGFTREYSRIDTWITWVTVAWPLAWTIIFVGGTLYALVWGIADESWAAFWHVYVWLIFAVGCVIVAWFTIGGFRDLVRMYAHLRRYEADARDDGSVRQES